MGTIFDLLNVFIRKLYFLTGDWGIAIILTTVIIRLCLLPLSLSQKRGIVEQQDYSSKLKAIKLKCQNDKEKMQKEMMEVSAKGAKGMLGCLTGLIQLPIMYGLYGAFSRIPVEVGSIIVPWIANIKLPDAYHIIPIAAVIIQLLPNIVATVVPVKNAGKNGISFFQMIVMGCFSLVFFLKAPVTLGLYWITSGIFSSIEQLLFSKFSKKIPAQ
jgi:membrane protein insertase, YidC/Oxa1 family, C-terminal domain